MPLGINNIKAKRDNDNIAVLEISEGIMTKSPKPISNKRKYLFVLFFLIVFIILFRAVLINQPERDNAPVISDLSDDNEFIVLSDSEQINLLLDNIRTALLNQDLQLYNSSFSAQIPDLNKKQDGLNELWKTYHILELHYEYSKEYPLKIESNQAEAIINWTMNLRHRENNQLVVAAQTNLVKFAKINDDWKITEINPQ